MPARTSHDAGTRTDRPVSLLALQRAAGNRAVSGMLEGSGAGGPAPPLQRQIGMGARFRRAMREDEERNRAIRAGKRPAGAEVVRLPDWNLITPRNAPTRTLGHRLAEMTLLTIPIPKLGVRVDLRASAGASLNLDTFYAGWLRNIQIGVEPWQAQALRLFGTDPGTLVALAPFAKRVRGLADLDVGGYVRLSASVSGRLDAVGRAVGLEVARLGFGLSATGSALAGLRLGGRVGFLFDRGDLRLRFDKAATAHFALQFGLSAFIEAALLGFRWRKQWDLVQSSLNRHWTNGVALKLDAHGPPAAVDPQLTHDENQFQLADLIKQIFIAATTQEEYAALAPPGGGGAGGGPGGPPAPTGRTPGQAIPMTWFKPPGAYAPSIALNGTRYFFTEPDWLEVPPRAGLADVRREAALRDGVPVIRIGVETGGRNYPTIGSVWPRTRVGAIRGGAKQDQFRRLLQHYGYAWGTYQADHVRDLQWAGRDAYDNLWPLEAARNRSGSKDVLEQPVTYRNRAGAVVTVPLQDTPRNLYFRIVAFG
ncbi:hypothetical protein ACH9EU_00275 [Kocuria sp. M1R5S2]